MEKNNKKCPYCGEEILTIAKKCKYCGEWLEEKQSVTKRMIACPICSEQIEEGTSLCPHCHESLIPNKECNENRHSIHTNKEQRATSFLSHYFINVILKHYADFKGKATRKQYWLYILFYLVIVIAMSCADRLLEIDFQVYEESLGYGWLFTLVSLVLWIPSLAITMRRLHDIGKSGWWILVALIPIVGIFWLLFLLCKKGNTVNPPIPLTTTDKIILNTSIIVVSILAILVYFKPFNHIQTSQPHNNWYLDEDTTGIDTLDNISYSENRQNVDNENDAEIKKQIIHDYARYYAIYTFCNNIKQAITNGYRGIGLEAMDGDPLVNDDLILISNEEYRWLLQQFDFSNFSRLLRAYANDSRELRSDMCEYDLGNIAIECLKKHEVVLNNQWFEIFNNYRPYNELQIEEFHNLGNKKYQVVFNNNISPNFVFNFDYSSGLTITTN